MGDSGAGEPAAPDGVLVAMSQRFTPFPSADISLFGDFTM